MGGQVLCVYCRVQPAHPDWQPFCSERCSLLDLSHWLDGKYRVEGPADEPPETAPDDPDLLDD